MTHGLLKTHCKLEAESRELLHRAMEELHLSARAYDRILKVARTIADLAGSKEIRPPHRLRGHSISHARQKSLALSCTLHIPFKVLMTPFICFTPKG